MRSSGSPEVRPDVAAFGVTQEDALRVRAMPDHRQTLTWAGLDVHLFATHIVASDKKSHWIVVGESRNVIAFAFRVAEELIGDAREPLAILRRFAARFGLWIDAGAYSGNLIAMANVPFTHVRKDGDRYQFNFQPGPEVEPSHHHHYVGFVRPNLEKRVVEVLLFFVVNHTLYTRYIAEVLELGR
jgi:hypothetical protein